MDAGVDVDGIGQAQLCCFSADAHDSEGSSPDGVECVALALGILVVVIAEDY